MKIAVDFPSVAYREGPEKVLALASAIEEIGYDEIAAFAHVVMGHPGEGRRTIYSAEMPIAFKRCRRYHSSIPLD